MRFTKAVSIICAICTFFSMGVQFSIFCGAPLGEFVLGGTYIVAPPEMRIAHLLFSLLWLAVGLSYLAYGKVIPIKTGRTVAKVFVVVNTAFLAYAVIWNFFITASIKETVIMGPITLVTFVGSVLLVYSQRRRRRRQKPEEHTTESNIYQG